ncbi:MAG: hypothetical protein J0M33_23815 [Anaerolineae bacterium]|nr:hypothetical protein [Anaerolineae bacterium]
MRRLVIAVTLLVLAIGSAWPASAQQGRDCGNGLPCGPIPWQRFNLPRLASPTPMPTLNGTAFYYPTAAPSTPGGPTPTPTAGLESIDTEPINVAIQTLQSVTDATPFTVVDSDGTPIASEEQISRVGQDAGTFFSYARSVLSPTTFGPIWPLVAFTFTALAVVLIVTVSTFLIPSAVAIFGIIRKIISTILEFIPL